MTTAGILVIGNEVLSGKVVEENAQYMIRGLRQHGVDLLRVNIVRDDVEVIARDVREMSKKFDVLFTSGGVGGTHDDVTMMSVAQGLNLDLIQNSTLYELLRKHYGDEMNASVLRMAEVPQGAEILGLEELRFPLIRVKNVFVFPGVPQFLKAKFDFAITLLDGVPYELETIYVSVSEDKIAATLAQVDAQWPEVEIGSYPVFDVNEYRVKITVESREKGRRDQAVASIKAQLNPDWIVCL